MINKRDPERIDSFLQVLGDVWKENPNQRFAQMILSSAARCSRPTVDPFFMEDDLLLEGIKAFGEHMAAMKRAGDRIKEVR
jgi:hypothetical protein